MTDASALAGPRVLTIFVSRKSVFDLLMFSPPLAVLQHQADGQRAGGKRQMYCAYCGLVRSLENIS